MAMLKSAILLLLIIGIRAQDFSLSFKLKHHDNEELLETLNYIHSQCPNITKIYELGHRSVKGVPLIVIEFSDRPGKHEILEPEFKYVANMHGNEVLGRELLLALADHLCQAYKSGDRSVQNLVNFTHLHLLPSMNPDGWQIATQADAGGHDWLTGRENANYVDLNRDFPDLDRVLFQNDEEGRPATSHLFSKKVLDHKLQPETQAVMEWILQYPFVLSANLHGGALVANFPYDESRHGLDHEYMATPDNDTFRHLALAYSTHHKTMSKAGASPPCEGDDFSHQGGITNGAYWYSVAGGMQDFNYLGSNDFEITLELGCTKYPPAEQLGLEWSNNKDALLHYMWQSHIGIKGLVHEAGTKLPLEGAVVKVVNITGDKLRPINHDVTTTAQGEYWRLLTPGQYRVVASKHGYQPQETFVQVNNPAQEQALRVDFELAPLNSLQPALHSEVGPLLCHLTVN
ncbi:CPE [Cordylochernes scorpioides]|uniref:CPE n=1 Tax=Cordylochernes scorpioides TaxID=51811 RepID=A0ABY6KZX4_9ARAC|nr:CPE [Cordylochernes scorpioides]